MQKEEIIKKFNIDLGNLEAEQKKLAKGILLKDSIDFSLVDRVAGCDIMSAGNKLIAAIVVLDSQMDIVEQQYILGKANFPYLSGFRAYRELPSLIECYNKLQENPDILFLSAHGITHPNGLGLASHFGLLIQKPTIGIAKKLIVGKMQKGMVYINSRICGAELKTREGSKPIYISPGHLISVKTSLDLTKRFLKQGHKLPEPLVKARKYINRIAEEIIRK